MPVSENLRRYNTDAVRERDRWRERYSEIVAIIRAYKREVKYFDSKNMPELAKKYRIILRALQNEADMMMLDRMMIREKLVNTAYRYE